MTGEDRDRLAAGFVMGLLERQEQQEAERLAASDAAFRSAVAGWGERFLELDGTAPPVSPADALWKWIVGSLTLASVATAREGRAPPFLVPDPLTAWRAFWRNLPFWRAAGLAASFATLAVGVGLGAFAQRSLGAPVLVAVLLTDASQPVGVINAFAEGQAQLVPFAGMRIPAGRAFEVWVILGANQSPISVGLVTEPRSHPLNLERVPSLSPNQTFALSVEPIPGSPTGLPTGPVLIKGTTTTAL